MKTIIKQLFFDEVLVTNLKGARLSEPYLYNQLVNGKITLQEYLNLL